MGRSEADDRFEKLLRAVGYAVLTLEKYADQRRHPGLVLDGVRLILDADNRTNVLAVVTASRGDEALVGFVGGLDVSSVLISIRKALDGGTLKWRADVPWGER